MTITPRRAPARSTRVRNRRPAPAVTTGRSGPAVRTRARHAAEPVPARPEIPLPPTAVSVRKGARRAPAHRGYLGAVALRCALYLGPLSVALAGGEALGQVAWPVPLLTLLLGWTAA